MSDILGIEHGSLAMEQAPLCCAASYRREHLRTWMSTSALWLLSEDYRVSSEIERLAFETVQMSRTWVLADMEFLENITSAFSFLQAFVSFSFLKNPLITMTASNLHSRELEASDFKM